MLSKCPDDPVDTGGDKSVKLKANDVKLGIVEKPLIMYE